MREGIFWPLTQWGVVVALCVGLVWVFSPPPEDISAVALHVAGSDGTSRTAVRVGSSLDRQEAERSRERSWNVGPSKLFSPMTWLKQETFEKTAPIAPPSSPVMSAPPLPFEYLGRIKLADGTVLHQVASADKVWSVTSGAVIDGNYRFEDVRGQNLVFIYLPLSLKQMLAITAEEE